jgi:hypothetical protein
MTATQTEEVTSADGNDTFTMVVTLKSGTQIRFEVTEYTVGRNGLNELARLKWTGAEGADTNLQYLSLDEVAAVHSEGLST